ncbi:MAG: enoyl-CoA hydratase [Alphaproteobacteria bacterium]
MKLKTVLVEEKDGVAVVTLNRPKALNALSKQLVADLSTALDSIEANEKIKVIVLTGGEKAFAAGADIKEMKDKTYPATYMEDFITDGWERLASVRKPVIAAVSGFALGGGNEIAMMCDIILASETAKFGQPEITLGITPGAGGTQRLSHLIGKSKAMDLCLTGRLMDAEEAEKAGLVSRIIPTENLMEEALKTATKMARLSLPALMMVKETVLAAQEMPLSQGIRLERRMFQSMFAFDDQKEGMAAFAEKRRPAFKDQ